jgi:hypothetical protein
MQISKILLSGMTPWPSDYRQEVTVIEAAAAHHAVNSATAYR